VAVARKIERRRDMAGSCFIGRDHSHLPHQSRRSPRTFADLPAFTDVYGPFTAGLQCRGGTTRSAAANRRWAHNRNARGIRFPVRPRKQAFGWHRRSACASSAVSMAWAMAGCWTSQPCPVAAYALRATGRAVRHFTAAVSPTPFSLRVSFIATSWRPPGHVGTEFHRASAKRIVHGRLAALSRLVSNGGLTGPEVVRPLG
jgi:hypothetical protein